MVSVDRQTLITQICSASGVEGKKLEEMHKQLSLMSEHQLLFVLRGINKNECIGLEVEKYVSPVKKGIHEKQKLTDEQAKKFSIETIEANIKAAEKIVKAQDLGAVSKSFDKLKQQNLLGNQDISTDNVKEVIANQKTGVQNLKYAKDGALSKRNYYLQNKDRLKQMIIRRLYTINSKSGDNFIDRNKGNYTKDEFAEFLEKYINTTVDNIQSLDSIKGIQHSLVMADEAKEAEFLDKFLANANNDKNKPKLPAIEGDVIKIKSDNIPPEFNSDEAISFEEVYKYERGTEYSKETVERYKQANDEMNFVTGAYNSLQKYNLSADKLLNDYEEAKKVYTDTQGNSHGGEEPSAETRKNQFLEFFNSYYSLKDDTGKADLKKLINQSKLPLQVKEKEDGSYDLDLSAYDSDSQKNRALNSLLRLGKQNQKKLFEKLLDGKTLEQYQSNYERTFAAAMGSDNAEELSQSMNEDNMSAIQRYAGNTATTGMALMVAGGILTAIPVTTPLGMTLMGIGQIGALGGMAARNVLGFADAYTRDNVSVEEIKELSKDLAMDVGGFIIGGAAGKKGLQYGGKIIAQGGNKTAGFIVEKGTDFTLSLAGDLAMMGILQSSDTSEGLLQGNLMGMVVSTVTGISSAKYADMKSKTQKPSTDLYGKAPEITPRDTKPQQIEDETVAPFAERALNEPQIGDIIIPDKNKVDIQNGDFDKNGDFVPDGTFTRTSKQPFAKSKTLKPTPWGNTEVAETYKDLGKQILHATKLPPYEVKNQLGIIKSLIEENPELKISDVSEMIIDMQSLNDNHIKDFLNIYNGLTNVKNFADFKENLRYLAKTANEITIDTGEGYIYSRLKDRRMADLTEHLANIQPEEFKKNLDYFKSLDSKLQNGVTQYDYNILFKVHDDKYFERLDVAKDYNKYLAEKRLFNNQLSYNTHMIADYSEEGFAIFKDNINLAKELHEKSVIRHEDMNNIVFSDNDACKKMYERLKTELPEEKINRTVWNLMTNRFAGHTRAQDTTIEMLKHMDNDMIKQITENDSCYQLFNYIEKLDETGSKNLILKTQILEKMPQLGQYQGKAEYFTIELFLKDYKVENPEKVLEFINIAEPAFLSRIENGNNYQASYDFNGIFNKGNLDLMIENAKLHQQLPQKFRDYLNSEQSMASQNIYNRHNEGQFDYTAEPKEFAQRIETIKKYNEKLPESVSEHIYNGSLTLKDEVLNVLSTFDPQISNKLVGYKKAEILNSADTETLEKFAKIIHDKKEFTDDELYNYIADINDNFINMLKNMTTEELDALSIRTLSSLGQSGEYQIIATKEAISLIPERIRKIIKEDSRDLYTGLNYNSKNKRYLEIIKDINKLSDEDLKSIGSKSLVKYLEHEFNPKSFNEKNIKIWRNVSQDIKDKLQENAFYLLTSEKELDIDLLNKRVENLKKHDVFNSVSGSVLCDVIRNMSEETEAMLNKIISDPSFDKNNTDYLIVNLTKINRGVFETSFIDKLINNPKLDINEIPKILSSLSQVKEISDQQQDFALYLLNRDDVDNKIINSLLSQINIKEINDGIAISSPLNKRLQDFAKELLDNPNIKNEDISYVLSILKNTETFDANKDLSLKIINSKKVDINKIYDNDGFLDERKDFTRYLLNEDSLNDQQIYSILNNTRNHFKETTDKIQQMLQELIADKSYGSDNNLVNFTEVISINEQTAEIQISLIKDLCHEKDFPKDRIPEIANAANAKNSDFARELCNDKDFPKTAIAGIVCEVNSKNIDFVRELCNDKDFPKNDISYVVAYLNDSKNDNDFITDLYRSKDFPKKQLKNITEYLIKNKNNSDNFKSLIATPELKEWTLKNLSNEQEIEILPGLSRTQKKLYSEAEIANIKKETPAPVSKPKPKAIEEAKPAEIAKAEETLVNLGVHPKMAPNFVKMCQQNGIVDKVKLDAVCALAQSGVQVNEIKNIFNLATGNALSSMNGQFRPDMIKDIVTYKQSGIDDVKFAANLAAAKNMSIIELKGRINTKIREDMVNRINNLPNDIKEKLKTKGTDLDAIAEKASAEPKAGKIKQADVAPIHLRSLDSIVGVEKLILNKYKNEIDQNIWGNPERFKVWAEEKLKKVLDFEQNPDYTAVNEYAKFNNARKEGVQSWYKYLKEESNYKDDVFVQLFVMDGITKEMKPNNAATPPAVSHASFEATYNALLENDTSVSFSKIYAQQTKLKAINQFAKQDVSMDGIEGKWVTIPQSQKGEPDYDEHIAMVQALAEGSSWCLRFENAHTYLQGGNLHFFVDKNGNSQVAINETNGQITQIQKRYDQDSTVPIPYANVIDTWRKENKYTGHEFQINNALSAKPRFDELKNKLAALQKAEDYLSIFKVLGINVSTAPDGTYILSAYTPKIARQYTLFDLGVNENKLMQNVSQINSSIDLNGSALTAMPQLKVITGALTFGDNKISDLRNLEKINGKNITWDK